MTAVATPVRERPILFSGEMVCAILDGRKTQTRRVVKIPRNATFEHCAVRTWDDEADRLRSIAPEPPDIAPYLLGRRIRGQYLVCNLINDVGLARVHCPHGEPGDQMWVREAWQAEFEWPIGPGDTRLHYWHEVPPGWRGAENAMRTYYRADWSEYEVVQLGDSEFSPQFAAHVDESELSEYDHDRPLPFRWKPSIHMPRWASRITLEITGVRVERLQDISEKDARAEGVEHETLSCRHAFAILWQELNGDRGFGWEKNPFIWVIEFRRIAR